MEKRQTLFTAIIPAKENIYFEDIIHIQSRSNMAYELTLKSLSTTETALVKRIETLEAALDALQEE